jgi:hypothetical protein
MKHNSFSCNKCKETFSRKSNAHRHNKTIHGEMALIFNSKTKSIIKTSIDTQDKDLIDVENLVLKTFGKIIQPYEELEKLLLETPPDLRQNTLSGIIISALQSSNPVKCINEAIDIYRSSQGMVKISECVSKSLKMHPPHALEMLRNFILNAPYARHRF